MGKHIKDLAFAAIAVLPLGMMVGHVSDFDQWQFWALLASAFWFKHFD